MTTSIILLASYYALAFLIAGVVIASYRAKRVPLPTITFHFAFGISASVLLGTSLLLRTVEPVPSVIPESAVIPGFLPTVVWVLAGLGVAFLLLRVEIALASFQLSGRHLVPLVEGKSREIASADGPRIRLAGVVIGAVSEEVLWRGALFPRLNIALGAIAAVSISSIAFGVAHGFAGLRNVLAKTIESAIWSMALLATGSLALTISSHIGLNLLIEERSSHTTSDRRASERQVVAR